jgi:uncharacterized protein YciI
MYVIDLTYVTPLEEIDRLLPSHVEWLAGHYAAGRFLASGRKVPRTGGVILAAKMARADLDAILAADPFRQAEVARYAITEVEISKTADLLQGLVGA